MKKIFNLLLPSSCLVCKQKLSHLSFLCGDCHAKLVFNKQVCEQCALPIESGKKCGACLSSPPPFNITLAPFCYKPPLTTWITQLKFQQKLANAKILAEILALEIEKHYKNQEMPSLIVPIPLHSQRLRQRGFNQAVEIAKPIAKKFNLPLIYDHFRRDKNTQAQSLLSAYARRANMAGAFKIDRSIAADHVAIVDDVMTTGQTVRVFSRLLQQSGIKKIDVWCCARVG